MVKARVQKRLYYKIGEACKELGIQPYVLRYWETEFEVLKPKKSKHNQRMCERKDVEIAGRPDHVGLQAGGDAREHGAGHPAPEIDEEEDRQEQRRHDGREDPQLEE